MATYQEIYNLRSDLALQNRVLVACIVAAEAIRVEEPVTPNHANRKLWAKRVFANPEAEARSMLTAVLAQNKSLSVAQIQSATDVALQGAVDAAVDAFALT